MPATIATELIRIAKQRNTAYVVAGALTTARARAISRIKVVAEWYKNKPPTVQTQAVRSLAPEIRQIIPGPDSPFGKLRDRMLDLLKLAEAGARA